MTNSEHELEFTFAKNRMECNDESLKLHLKYQPTASTLLTMLSSLSQDVYRRGSSPSESVSCVSNTSLAVRVFSARCYQPDSYLYLAATAEMEM